jgi:hypothetical protein
MFIPYFLKEMVSLIQENNFQNSLGSIEGEPVPDLIYIYIYVCVCVCVSNNKTRSSGKNQSSVP